ncbi:MAG: dynamin family protein [Syntrophomonadaceae bacterium]|nr:dynamin family protein [Syntrophomonadaceae bacterium]
MDKQKLVQSLELLGEIQAVCDDFKLYSLNKTLKSIKNFAEENQYLDIAVLGQFKAGKSSFLNGLMNRHLLPVGNIPVTSVITRIQFGENEAATVTFLDGRSQPISMETVSDYVSETGNPENVKNVAIVDIKTPLLSKFKGLRLVDTPGIGSVWEHNTETTVSWFPETGGVLFIISAEKPISENELNLLKEIYRFSPEIAIVISKADLFDEKHLLQIESFTSQVIKKNFDREFPILRYSAREDTLSFNKAIENRIFQPLAANRGQKFLEILHYKIEAVTNTCLSYLDIAYQASLRQEEEKSRLKEAILDEHLNAHYVRRELILITGSYKEKTRDHLRIYLESYRHVIENRLFNDYERSFSGWKGNLYKVTRQYEQWLKKSLEAELKEILLKEEKSFELLNAVKKHLAFYLKSFRERLSHNVEQVLGTNLQLEQWEITVGELKKPDISISRTFDSHIDLLWFIFPMFLWGRLFKLYFRGQIAPEVEKNLHRLTSSLNERINKGIDNLMNQALVYMNEEANMIEQLLSEHQVDSEQIKECIDRISWLNN